MTSLQDTNPHLNSKTKDFQKSYHTSLVQHFLSWISFISNILLLSQLS